jgi:hypothetical protein
MTEGIGTCYEKRVNGDIVEGGVYSALPSPIIQGLCLKDIMDTIRIDDRYIYARIEAETEPQEKNIDHSIGEDSSH